MSDNYNKQGDNAQADDTPLERVQAGTHICVTEEETLVLGRRIALDLSAGDIVCITGDLGAGKTVLCRGIADGLGVNPSDVRSPTFSIVHEYNGTIDVLHFDCYRMNKAEEALQIGWEDYLQREAVILIEWPEIIESLLPANCLGVKINSADAVRAITIDGKDSCA